MNIERGVPKAKPCKPQHALGLGPIAGTEQGSCSPGAGLIFLCCPTRGSAAPKALLWFVVCSDTSPDRSLQLCKCNRFGKCTAKDFIAIHGAAIKTDIRGGG